MSKLYTTAEAAAVFGVDTRTVSKLISRNVLKAERFGQRTWMLSEEEVQRYQQERRKPGRPPLKTIPQRAGHAPVCVNCGCELIDMRYKMPVKGRQVRVCMPCFEAMQAAQHDTG